MNFEENGNTSETDPELIRLLESTKDLSLGDRQKILNEYVKQHKKKLDDELKQMKLEEKEKARAFKEEFDSMHKRLLEERRRLRYRLYGYKSKAWR
jgi:hypothetical protein